jgi:hypothetical protein
MSSSRAIYTLSFMGGIMKLAALLILALTFFVATIKADCPTTASCPEHDISGYPTGQYKWNGSTEYAQFKHSATGSAPEHAWWEKCN